MEEPNIVPQIYVIDVGLRAIPFTDVTESGRILAASATTVPPFTLISNQQLPDGIDVSPEVGKIFWTSMGIPGLKSGAIFSCTVGGDDVQEVIRRGTLYTPKQLQVEPKSRKIYFADREGLSIMRSNFDGSDLESLVQTGDTQIEQERLDQTRWCVGVALCMKQGKIYWTQKGPSKGGKGRLFRTNIHLAPGENPRNRSDNECLLQNLPEPINLAIDEEEQMIYWTDRGELPLGNSVNRMSIEKPSIIPPDSSTISWPIKDYELLARNLNEAIGLKLDLQNHHIYVSDLGGSIYRFDFDGANMIRFCEGHGSYAGLTLAYSRYT